MSDCADLVGLRYRLGADGSDGEIDCIHLVYTVLERLDIVRPEFNEDWYNASSYKVLRDLLRWGVRVDRPEYDGDVLLMTQGNWAFAVVWLSGVLYINTELEKVSWCSLRQLSAYRCFRTKSS
mgnify:CR=1 FL=1|jgi:hypothetical protein